MNKIILKDLLEVICEYDLVKIYMERKHKYEGYNYLTTKSPKDILDDDEDEYLLDSDIRVTELRAMHDDDCGEIIEIVVKEIKNESE